MNRLRPVCNNAEMKLTSKKDSRAFREAERIRILKLATRQSKSVELKMKIHMLKMKYERA